MFADILINIYFETTVFMMLFCAFVNTVSLSTKTLPASFVVFCLSLVVSLQKRKSFVTEPLWLVCTKEIWKYASLIFEVPITLNI